MNFSTKVFVGLAVSLAANLSVYSQTSQDWINVELTSPGTLGVEILYQADKLADVTHLRISGPLNDSDWGNIKNLTSIQEIDLKNAITSEIPESSFKNRETLTSVVLPDNLLIIGAEAFRGTSIKTVDFPSSLQSLGRYSFYNSKLESLEFPENNSLTTLGSYAFANCDALIKVTFPKKTISTVIPESFFNGCSNLVSVSLPSNIISIENYAFEGCSSMTLIDLPESLETIRYRGFGYSGLTRIVIPDKVNFIDDYVFYYNRSLEEVVLPSTIHNLSNYTFAHSNSLKLLTCKSPTPPTLSYDPFYDVNLSNVVLTVPDFALADYKLDDFWLQFGKIQGGASSDHWDVAGTVSLTNNRRFDGTPSVSIQPGGALQIGGTAAQPMKDFMLLNEYKNSNRSLTSAQFLNTSSSVTAGKISERYYVNSGYWCFLSLPFDVKVSEITHSDPNASFVVRYYDGAERAANDNTGNSWKNLEPTSIIKRGEGFILQTNIDGYVTFNCVDNGAQTIFDPNSVTLTLEENKAPSSANTGWNFVANPYPSYYDLYYAMLECPVTIYDQYNRKYVAYSLIDDDVVLAPNEPFFIQSSDEIREIIFSNHGCQFSPDASRPAPASLLSSRQLFDLNLSFNDVTDRARIVFNNDASPEYELNRDASKFLSDNKDIPQIFTISTEGDYMAINERPVEDGIVKLGFYAPSKGKMALFFSRLDGNIILIDHVADKELKLEVGERYFFDVDEEGFDTSRFSTRVETTGVDELLSEKGNTRISVNNGELCLKELAGRNITVSTLDGKIVLNSTVKSDNETFMLPAGLYVVKCGETVFKCYIK